MCIRISLTCVCFFIGLSAVHAGQQPTSFARQVQPFFAKYCIECHNPDKLKGGLNLENYKSLQEGGNNGPVLVPGKPDQSRMVLLVEGKAKPAMPPKKANQPQADEIALLRAWVADGARDDSADLKVAIPDIKPRIPVTGPVAALAYRPDGKRLAAGGVGEVILIDVDSDDVIAKLPGQTGLVTALAFSADGQRLAVAEGEPGTSGEVRLYGIAPSGLPEEKPQFVLAGHRDRIYDLAFSPDGKILATCSYDRLIKLWEVATGQELRTLKDHSDAVYSVAFSPDGRLLASAAADRTVKVWDVATGNRLYTLSESTDWLYAVAWSPDGRHISAAGVDKSIRVWEAGPTGGKLVNSVFAHEGPITRLIYSADGMTLYSLGEDRTVKAWNTSQMVERKVYPRQTETVLSMAVRPDHKQLAIGRYDGLGIFLDEASGQAQAFLPVRPKAPQVSKISPTFGPRAVPIRILFEGKHLDAVTEVVASLAGVAAKFLPDGKTANQLVAKVIFPANAPAGVYQISLKNSVGESAKLPFTVDLFPRTIEQEPNDSPSTGQKVTLPATVLGDVGKAGDVDFYRFEARAGQQIGVQTTLEGEGSQLDPVLQLCEETAHILAESSNGTLGYTCAKAGTYALGIRDREYRGGAKMGYRLHVGDVPVVTAVFPLGLQRGTEMDIHVEGVNLGDVKSVRSKAPADANPGTRLPLGINTSRGTPLAVPSLVVGEFPEVMENGETVRIPVPGTGNGRVERPGMTGTWKFLAQKGKRLIVEVEARRLGSPLDSTIEILDDKGQPVPRAVLRCLAQTYTTFKDHDSSSPGIRLESVSDLAVNDYILAGSELIRLRALPKSPDDDCQFFTVGGQRLAYLDTTPTYHSMGTPMYKVSINPPGTMFPPNGLPLVTVFYRNDDGGPGYGKDSRLLFDPPADGEYMVRVGDSRGEGRSDYVYRLTVRPPRPGFNISFNPNAPSVWKGGAIPITVTAERIDGFVGPIETHLENLPPGFSAPTTTIGGEDVSTDFALYAEPTAVNPTKMPPLKLVAKASIEGREVIREATGGLPKVADAGDIVTTTDQSEAAVKPGGQVTITARIDRRNGFTGRVPLDVKGLPFGVHVLDIGLNGILITEKESSRAFVVYCESWVQPMTHPFVVLARNEGKGTEFAAKSVLLKVVNSQQ